MYILLCLRHVASSFFKLFLQVAWCMFWLCNFRTASVLFFYVRIIHIIKICKNFLSCFLP